ncbi:MAG TPA: hypothetical protein VKR58_13880, partial [Aquella sp.]|nr:hypothetical protein [Aquella sp.]
MDIVILHFAIDINTIRNLPSKGVLYFKLSGSPWICFVSHQMNSYYWKSICAIDYTKKIIEMIHTYKNLESFIPDNQCLFKLINLIPNDFVKINNSMNV